MITTFHSKNVSLELYFGLNPSGMDMVKFKVIPLKSVSFKTSEGKTKKTMVKDTENTRSFEIYSNIVTETAAGPNLRNAELFVQKLSKMIQDKEGMVHYTYKRKVDQKQVCFAVGFRGADLPVLHISAWVEGDTNKPVFKFQSMADAESLLKQLTAFIDPNNQIVMHMMTNCLNNYIKEAVGEQIKYIVTNALNQK